MAPREPQPRRGGAPTPVDRARGHKEFPAADDLGWGPDFDSGCPQNGCSVFRTGGVAARGRHARHSETERWHTLGCTSDNRRITIGRGPETAGAQTRRPGKLHCWSVNYSPAVRLAPRRWEITGERQFSSFGRDLPHCPAALSLG